MHSRGPPREEKGSRDCLEHLWTIQSSPRPRSNSYFYLYTIQPATDTDQMQLHSPPNEVFYDPFGQFGRQTAHLRPPSGWNSIPTRPPNCYWCIYHGWTQQNATMGYCRFFENAALRQLSQIVINFHYLFLIPALLVFRTLHGCRIRYMSHSNK
mgnify:CR=1 FL=1